MTEKIEKTAVLGAGVMGAQLAGHFANAGIPTLLFDISQDLSEQGIENLKKLKPAPLYKPKNTSLITPCTYENHIELIKEADWVLEAVAEKIDIKHKLFESVSPYLKTNAVLSSNTSGIPLNDLIKGLPESIHSRFMITHFFNPPRYMRLLELVRSEHTDDSCYNSIAEFGETVLGKGIVHAKDTPNFIANRIGVYGMMLSIHQAIEMNLSVESVDKLTGTVVGRQKSATFRTADLVGLDTLSHVAQTSYDRGENDEERKMFNIPDILNTLIESGRLGAKTRSGFYKKEGGEILSLDLNSGEYKKQVKERFDGFRLAKDHQKPLDKIKALAYSDDKAGKYFWEILSKTLIYSANRIPEISDDIVNVDNALKWGIGGAIFGIKKLFDWGSTKQAGGKKFKQAHKDNEAKLNEAGVKRHGKFNMDTNALGQWRVQRDGQWTKLKYENLTDSEQAAIDNYKEERERLRDLKKAMNKEKKQVEKDQPMTGVSSGSQGVPKHSKADWKIIRAKQAKIQEKYNAMLKGESGSAVGDSSNVSSLQYNEATGKYELPETDEGKVNVVTNPVEETSTVQKGKKKGVEHLSSDNSDNLLTLNTQVQLGVVV